MASAAILAAIILAAIVVPWISPYNYYTPQWELLDQAPTWHGGHIFGTDDLGRDLLVRIMWGCRVSLLIGTVASVVSVVIGVLWGAAAGFKGGTTDALMMRIVDILYSVPFIPFVIVLVVMFGRDLFLIFVAIGAVSWLDIARIVRGQTLSLRSKEFIEAARASGVSGPAIVVRHLVPNLLGIVMIYATLTVPLVILFEAFLSFLGSGRAISGELAGRAGIGRSQRIAILPLHARYSRSLPGRDRVLPQLSRGRVARRARPERALMAGDPLLQVRDLSVEFSPVFPGGRRQQLPRDPGSVSALPAHRSAASGLQFAGGVATCPSASRAQAVSRRLRLYPAIGGRQGSGGKGARWPPPPHPECVPCDAFQEMPRGPAS